MDKAALASYLLTLFSLNAMYDATGYGVHPLLKDEAEQIAAQLEDMLQKEKDERDGH